MRTILRVAVLYSAGANLLASLCQRMCVFFPSEETGGLDRREGGREEESEGSHAVNHAALRVARLRGLGVPDLVEHRSDSPRKGLFFFSVGHESETNAKTGRGKTMAAD
jgi:hypothetical protein